MLDRSKYPTKIINCPDCGIECNYVAESLAHMPYIYPGGYYPHERGSKDCLERQIKNLKEENKCLSAEFTNELTQSPLEIIRAKCEQHWNKPYALCPEEIQEDLGFIHQLAWSAEKEIKNIQEENKRLSATFTGKLTQSPLEMIRAKCEQYWNEPYTLCPEETHVILEFIHQLAWSAEKEQHD